MRRRPRRGPRTRTQDAHAGQQSNTTRRVPPQRMNTSACVPRQQPTPITNTLANSPAAPLTPLGTRPLNFCRRRSLSIPAPLPPVSSVGINPTMSSANVIPARPIPSCRELRDSPPPCEEGLGVGEPRQQPLECRQGCEGAWSLTAPQRAPGSERTASPGSARRSNPPASRRPWRRRHRGRGGRCRARWAARCRDW